MTGDVHASSVKMQGIKTKAVPVIRQNVKWSGGGRWVEPFVGSGVVALTLAPERAFLAVYRALSE